MSSKSKKANQLSLGPLRLPREITEAGPVLRLFMAYLARPATLAALEIAATERLGGSKATAKRAMAAAYELNRRIGIPRSRDDLRKLVTHALELRMAWHWMRDGISTDVLPENAIPSEEVIETCLKAYREWVADLSRAK